MKKNIRSLTFFTTVLLIVITMSFTSFAAEDSTPIRYGESTITNENIAYVYDIFESEFSDEKTPKKINIPEDKTIKSDEVHNAFVLFISDYPEYFWIEQSYGYSTLNGNVVEIVPNYVFEGTELKKAKEDFENAISEIMQALPNTNNYEKSIYLHDAIALRVTYEEVGEHQTAYGALVSGKAVCAGYAAAYQLLLNRAGIPAWTVTGFSNRPGESIAIPHAWNIVWLEDNVCVYSDVTWDDGETELFHYYLNISKDEMAQDHQTSADISLPECNHVNESYFDVTNRTVNDSTTTEELALLFGLSENGSKKAIFLYEGADIDAFLQNIRNNLAELYEALSGAPGSINYRTTYISNEIHLTITGNFEKETYLITINPGLGINYYGNSSQYVKIGQEMTEMSFIAAAGYLFPEEYAIESVNGISISRVSETTIIISGTPTADTEITLPAATEKSAPEVPDPEVPDPEVPDPEVPDPEVPAPDVPVESEFSIYVNKISIQYGNKAEFAAIKEAFILYEALSDDEKAQDAQAHEKLMQLTEDYNVLAKGHNEKISHSIEFSAKTFSLTSVALAAVLFLLKKLYIGG